MPTPDASLPDKHYYRIGEVADLLGVKPHVVRYWESEFAVVKPTKTNSNQRLYRRKDVETLMEIKRLLRDERLTIEGARKRLRGAVDAPASAGPDGSGDSATGLLLAEIRAELEALLRLLG